jgi:hypothetical protein
MHIIKKIKAMRLRFWIFREKIKRLIIEFVLGI